MGIKEKSNKIAKNAFFMYVRMLLIMLINLYTSRVTLKCLGIDDYGIYNVVGGIVTMFSFINSAMASSIQRFLNIAIEKNDGSSKTIFTSSIHIHLIIAFIVLLLSETIGLWFLNEKIQLDSTRLFAANCVYQCSVFSTLIMIISVPYNAMIIAQEKMSAFAYISIAEASLKLLIVLLLIYFNTYDSLIIYALLLLGIQIIIRFLYQHYCYKNFDMPQFTWNINRHQIKEIGSFAGWSFLGNIAIIGLTQGVNIVLNLFFGPVVNAARGIAVQVQNAVQGFASNFQVAINPQIIKSYSAGDIEYMHKLIITSSKFSFYVLMILIIPIFLEINSILDIWLDIVPNHTGNFVRLILGITLFETCANSVTTGINANGHIKKYQSSIGTILLLVVPISYIALHFGLPAETVFCVHLAITIIAQAIRLVFAKNLIKLSIRLYIREVYVKIFEVLVISLIIPIFLQQLLPSSFLRLIIIIFTSIIVSSLTIYLIGMNINERKMAKEKVYQLINKLR